MAEKFDIEKYKLDNPGYSDEFYEQVKSNKEGGNPYSIFYSLFKKKEKEDVPKYDTKLPEIKITKETAEKVIKKAINSDDQPSLKDLATTADLKLKAEEDPKTKGLVDALIFATGGPLPDFSNKTKTEIADNLAANDLNIYKVSDTKFININTGENIYQNIGKNQLTRQAMNGLLEAGYSMGQLLTIPIDLIK